MAFKRYYPTKDTTIANGDGLVDTNLSNMGASEILNLYRTTDYNTTASILIAFDPIPSGHQAILKMFDAQHTETIPTEFSATIRPLEQAWTEGQGHDLDNYTDLGEANNEFASLNVAWGTITGTLSASTYFSTGHEDLEVNISSLTASMPNGLKIDIKPVGNYYIKKFHSRQSHFSEKRPYIETRWEDWTGSLSVTQKFLITAPGPWSGSLVDIPPLTGSMSGTIVSITDSTVDPTGPLSLTLNLKPVYYSSEMVRFNVSVNPMSWDLAVVPTASSESPGVVLTNAYYRVVNAITDEVVVPFGSGSLSYTKLSYEDRGNYFYFDMASMPANNLLRFDFQYDISGTSTFYKGNEFLFRVK